MLKILIFVYGAKTVATIFGLDGSDVGLDEGFDILGLKQRQVFPFGG